MADDAKRARGVRFRRSAARPPARARSATAVALSLLVTLATVPLAANAAHAEPTVAEIEARIDAAWADLEPMIERHNATRIELAEKQERAEDLATKIAPLQLKVDVATAEITDLAIYAFKGGNASAYNALLGSGSPTAFTDQLVLLDQFSRARHEQLSDVLAAKREYEAEKAPLDDLISELTALEESLAERADEIDAEIEELQDLRLEAYGESGALGDLRPAPCPTTYPGGAVAEVLKFACAQIGKPYVWGADGPDSYDCSGLTKAAWQQAGVYLPHNAAAQRQQMPYVDRDELRAGDLVFYNGLSHVGIYVGGGWIVHASQAGVPIQMRGIDVGSIHSYGRPG